MSRPKSRSPRLLKHKGTAKVTPLIEDGRKRGYQVDYEDGRREVVVRPDTIRTRTSVNGQ